MNSYLSSNCRTRLLQICIPTKGNEVSKALPQVYKRESTSYWSGHNIKKGKEYAILTNIIHEEWAEVSVKGHKKLKGLKTQNLRDHMSEAELIFTALAELSTRQIAESDDAVGMKENKVASKKGGTIAKNARIELEEKTGKKVVSSNNFIEKGAGSKKLSNN